MTYKKESNMEQLIDMLRFMRPEGSFAQTAFCNRFLKPVFGEPDDHGNYIMAVGDKPNVAFVAHHDTVHRKHGLQKLHISAKGIVTIDKKNKIESSCLGADCTTGVWLILQMIKNKVPGYYIVHAGEEIGCVGSKALVAGDPTFLDHLDAVISFDRFGTESIVTHQLGDRTCSDEFATSLASILDMPQLKPDPTGAFTDSVEYMEVVPECTNLSVGYYNQHTARESQDLVYLGDLLDALLEADWSKLDIVRTPEPAWAGYGYGSYPYNWAQGAKDPYADVNKASADAAWMDSTSLLGDLCRQYPEEIADLLRNMGFDAHDVMDELRIQPTGRDVDRYLTETQNFAA